MKYQGVFFDFDYTLGDATVSILAGYEFALTGLGWPAPEREAVRRTVGYTVPDGYTMLTGDRDEANRARAHELFAQVARPMQRTTTTLFPGARELLERLHGQGVTLAVVSTKGSDTLGQIMEHLGIRHLFSLVVGGQDVAAPKPDPEGVLLALDRLGLDRRQVLYCGDSLVDAQTAQNAALDFCGVLNGTTTARQLAGLSHVHLAPNLDELGRWLAET